MTKSSESPLVSIIMPVYNSQQFLEESIRSVLAQAYTNWELLVVDNGSTDNSREIAREFAEADPRVRTLVKDDEQGVAPARRHAIDNAQGEWIAFLDSDDLWAPNKLEIQMAKAQESGSRFLFTASAFIDAEGNPKDYIMHAPEEITYRQILKQNIISHSSVLIRKELLDGSFKEPDNSIRDDFSAWIRILRNRESKAVGIDQPLLIYRVSGNSLSSNKLYAAWCALKTYCYAGLSIPEALFYWFQYIYRSLRKYSNLYSN